ncbi:unnamed protein product [Prunus armeniaca]
MDKCTDMQFERSQASRAGLSRRGEGQEQAAQHAGMSQALLKVDKVLVQN